MSTDVEIENLRLEIILGPHAVGVMVAIFLFGPVTIQTYSYYRKYPDDHMGLKALVGFVWILLLAYTILLSFSLYERMVIGFGRVYELARYPKGVCVTFGISGVLGATIQSFFANRLRKLSGAIIVPMICWILCFFRVGLILAVSIVTCQVHSVEEYVDHWIWLGDIALAVSATVDVTISTSLSYCLWVRRKDIFKHAQKVVDKLILFTIQTGVITSTLSLAMLVLSITSKTFAFLAVFFAIPGMFGIYLLASLNSRQSLRNDMQPKPSFIDLTPVPPFPRAPSSRPSISVDSEANITRVIFARDLEESDPGISIGDKSNHDIPLGPLSQSKSQLSTNVST